MRFLPMALAFSIVFFAGCSSDGTAGPDSPNGKAATGKATVVWVIASPRDSIHTVLASISRATDDALMATASITVDPMAERWDLSLPVTLQENRVAAVLRVRLLGKSQWSGESRFDIVSGAEIRPDPFVILPAK